MVENRKKLIPYLFGIWFTLWQRKWFECKIKYFSKHAGIINVETLKHTLYSVSMWIRARQSFMKQLLPITWHV
jgi:hypothetical protein